MLRIGTVVSPLLLALAGLGCSGGGSSPSSPSSNGQGRAVEVVISEFEFSPKSITIEPGQTVRWVLRGNDFTHTTTHRDGAWDSGFVFTADGATFERTFTSQDLGKTFNYSCKSHRNCCVMQGSIRIGSDAPPPDAGY